MNVRVVLCMFVYSLNLHAMMKEDVLPISGSNIAPDKLPAALCMLVREKYPELKEQHITYEMDNKQGILAMQGSEPVVKIFSHENDEFKELQELGQSTSFAIHPLGIALAVAQKENNGPSRAVDYYVRAGVFFTNNTTLTFKGEITGIAFNKDGSRLRINLCTSSGKQETKEYEKGDGGGLEATGLMESVKRRLSFGRQK